MENFENFSEFYYPKDIVDTEKQTNESSQMHKNSLPTQNLSFEDLSKILGNNNNLFASFLSNQLGDKSNLNNLLNNPSIFNSLSPLFEKKNSNSSAKKERSFDTDFFESY